MSTLKKTTYLEKSRLYHIADLMLNNNVPNTFIEKALNLAEKYEGAYDLFVLWEEEQDENEKNEIISDLQEEIEDEENKPSRPTQIPYIEFKHLDEIHKNVIKFKKHLRAIVDSKGGISILSQKTGIPQPSLSRFFKSPSMPRIVTLDKIAVALEIELRDIVCDYVRR